MSPISRLPPPSTKRVPFTPMPRAVEQRIARRWREQGDRRDFDSLVLANTRLVPLMVRDYSCPPADYADMIQEGTLGLMEAVRHFDPERGVKLSTYAAYWVRAYALRFLGRLRRRREELEPEPFLRAGSDATIEEQEGASEERGLVRETLERFCAGLKPRDRELMAARWTGVDQPSLASVGERFGITRERARQVEAALLARLRPRLEEALGEAA
jgi:RNA polymerase sigma-32 factor